MSKLRFKKVFVILMITILASSVMPIQSYSKDSGDGKKRIVVSLGDSYSSGEGIPEFYGQDKNLKDKVKDPDWLAHRSTKSWPGKLDIPNVGILKDHRDDNWYFVAASGAVTDNLRHKQEKKYHFKSKKGTEKLEPQLEIFDKLDENPDYVTMTMGGNDADFAKIIMTCYTTNGFLNKNALSDKLDDVWIRFFESGGIRDDLKYAYDDIEDKAGTQANIIIAGYPQLINENGGKNEGSLIQSREAKLINENVSKFNTAIENIVKICQGTGMKIHFVSVEDAFNENGGGAYSENELIQKIQLFANSEDIDDKCISSSYSVHPNERGAEVYADCVQKKINELEGIESSTDDNEEEQSEDIHENMDIPEDAIEYNGHKYCMFKGAESFAEASDFCRSKGGYMATVTSKKENDFLFEYMKQKGYKNAYFGFSDEDVEGDWKWSNDEEVDFTNWHRNEPNSKSEDEDYAMFYYKYDDGTWNDGDFGRKTLNDYDNEEDEEIVFICEWGEYTKQKPQTSKIQNIALTLDTSDSMSGNPINETKKASIKFIDTVLQSDTGIGLVTYNSEAFVKSGISKTKNKLHDQVDKCFTSGGTNMEAGLRDAAYMLNASESKKKTIVLMSDGEPNNGLVGDELIEYAKQIKESGINIYTIGFFEDTGYKTSQQLLMEQLASPGHHYEVASAEGLTDFFNDIADQINGQKYIYIKVACPVDVSVTYEGETLDSAKDLVEGRTEFGTLTYEEGTDDNSNDADDNNRTKIIRLKEGPEYDIKITGTGRGIMNYTIGFMNEDGEYNDFREFNNIRVTNRTKIDSVASVSEESVLKIDEDGDGKYDLKLAAKKNGRGEAVKEPTWILYICVGVSLVVIVLIITFIVLTIKKKYKREGK